MNQIVVDSLTGERNLLLPSFVGIHAKHLKEQYLKDPIIQDDPWPPSVGQHYVNLALIQHSENPTKDSHQQEDLLRGIR